MCLHCAGNVKVYWLDALPFSVIAVSSLLQRPRSSYKRFIKLSSNSSRSSSLASVLNPSLLFLCCSHHYKQSLQRATCPRRKSLQGQRRLYLGEWPAQLNSKGSLWRLHSRRITENAGRMWLISESTTSHCTSNLRGKTQEYTSEDGMKLQVGVAVITKIKNKI